MIVLLFHSVFDNLFAMYLTSNVCVACALCVSIALHEKFVAQNHSHVHHHEIEIWVMHYLIMICYYL